MRAVAAGLTVRIEKAARAQEASAIRAMQEYGLSVIKLDEPTLVEWRPCIRDCAIAMLRANRSTTSRAGETSAAPDDPAGRPHWEGMAMPALTRREVLAASAASAAATGTAAAHKPTLCLFTKHLPHLGYKELAATLRSLGFAGADLTTRPRGHVLPENVERDLPLAHAALASEGIALPMVTTGLLSNRDPAARPTLYTAAKLGIPFFKLGYYRYQYADFERHLAKVKADMESLAAIAGHAGITGGFHNHSGTYVGSALWDHWWLLRDTDSRQIGFYFDPCHATIEGGSAGWEIGFHRLRDRLKMVACKDFYWEKSNGKWRSRMCPLGQGMVDYPKFFKLLAASGFSGPISLHVEYQIEAPTEAQRIEKEMHAIEADFAYLKSVCDSAYGAA